MANGGLLPELYLHMPPVLQILNLQRDETPKKITNISTTAVLISQHLDMSIVQKLAK